MSKTINSYYFSGGGGVSADNAILLVTVPLESTVTATKSGVTITPTMWISAADATVDVALFVIDQAQFDSITPWTVTATHGTNTVIETVLISTNKAYELTLSFALDLYINGDTCDAVTGGWGYATFLNTSNYSSGTLDTAHNGTTCYLLASGTTKQISAVTKSTVDLTDYNTLNIEVSDYTFYGSGYRNLYVLDSRTNVSSPLAGEQITSTGVFTVNVSSITGSHYVGVYLNSGSAGSCALGFTRMYLSK